MSAKGARIDHEHGAEKRLYRSYWVKDAVLPSLLDLLMSVSRGGKLKSEFNSRDRNRIT
jgi:hypothetical protein